MYRVWETHSWKWTPKSWHTGKYNRSLIRFHDLCKLHLCNEDIKRELSPAIRNITDFGMDRFDSRILPHITRVTKLSIGQTLVSDDALSTFFAANTLTKLRHLKLYNVQ
jgi:hypothetical protein